MRKSTPCSFGVIGQSRQRSRTFTSVTPSSTPPGERGSAFTRPVTSSVDSCVAPVVASHTVSGTSAFETTHWRYPLPSRRTRNQIFPPFLQW